MNSKMHQKKRHKAAEATGNLAEKKIADKTKKAASKSDASDPSKSNSHAQIDETFTHPMAIPKEKNFHQKKMNKLLIILDYHKYKYLYSENGVSENHKLTRQHK